MLPRLAPVPSAAIVVANPEPLADVIADIPGKISVWVACQTLLPLLQL